MSNEENKIIACRLVEELFGQGNLAVADELIAVNAVDHDAHRGHASVREGQKQFATMLHAGFTEDSDEGSGSNCRSGQSRGSLDPDHAPQRRVQGYPGNRQASDRYRDQYCPNRRRQDRGTVAP